MCVSVNECMCVYVSIYVLFYMYKINTVAIMNLSLVCACFYHPSNIYVLVFLSLLLWLMVTWNFCFNGNDKTRFNNVIRYHYFIAVE